MLPWSIPLTYCGLIAYKALYENGKDVDPMLFTFDTTTLEFKIESMDLTKSDLSPYRIKITGTLHNGVTNTTFFTVTVNDPCVSCVYTAP